jgi:hypothetical protein
MIISIRTRVSRFKEFWFCVSMIFHEHQKTRGLIRVDKVWLLNLFLTTLFYMNYSSIRCSTVNYNASETCSELIQIQFNTFTAMMDENISQHVIQRYHRGSWNTRCMEKSKGGFIKIEKILNLVP